MNIVIENLAQIAGAAEYFDRKTGAAWRIRSALTNMGVWSCNNLLRVSESGDTEAECRAMVEVATIRSWLSDCDSNALTLDLTPPSVRKTLGLEREVDHHAEAVKIARGKCLRSRSALKFKEHYEAALAALDEKLREREERVERITWLLSDHSFGLTLEQYGCFKQQGVDVGRDPSDDDLYDDAAVERQTDTLAEVVGNTLEAMLDECEAELVSAITTSKIDRLSGYRAALLNMLSITGVDMAKLAERRVKLSALVDEQVKAVDKSAADIEAEIEALTPAPVSKPERKLERVKKAA